MSNQTTFTWKVIDHSIALDMIINYQNNFHYFFFILSRNEVVSIKLVIKIYYWTSEGNYSVDRAETTISGRHGISI